MLDFRKLSLYSLYLYIISLYTLAYDPQLNIISKAFMMCMFGFLFLFLLQQPYIKKGKIYVFFALFMIYITISSFWSPSLSSSHGLNMTVYQLMAVSLAIYNIVKTEEEVKHLFLAMFLGCLIMHIYTISFYGISGILTRVQSGVQIGEEINQSNAFGYYSVIAFEVTIYKVVYEKKYWYLLFSFVTAFMTLISGSRRALLLIIIATAVLLAIKNKKINVSKIIIVLLICILLFTVLYNVESLKPVFERFTSFLETIEKGDISGDNSMATRSQMIDFGIEKFKENPIFGYGSYGYNILYGNTFGWARPSHNNYIQILVDYGIIGFVIFFGMYFYIIRTLLNNLKKAENSVSLVILIMIMELISFATYISITNKFAYIYLTIGFIYCEILENKKEGNENELSCINNNTSI